MTLRTPDATSERRLDELRERAASAPLPQPSATTGYWGMPLLKQPVWSWEIPLYFFVGGAAGASAVIAAGAQLSGAHAKLVRDARRLAALGAFASAPLLILDLGRPERFLHMLRVFKPQSPMSVGVWILSAFGAGATGAAIVKGPLGDAAAGVAAIGGLGMATYTGVLIGATSIPVWAKHVATLPIHFGASGLAASVGILELIGHDEPALNLLGLAAAAFESYTGWRIESDRGEESEPLRHGSTGITTRAGGLFSGPLPLVLRLLGLRSKRARRAASAAAILGSLITRLAWVEAGKVSARRSTPR